MFFLYHHDMFVYLHDDVKYDTQDANTNSK